jgi:hypothetical protein
VSIKKMFFSLLFAVTVVGFISIKPAGALTFNDWNNTWFAIKSSEKGKIGPVVDTPQSIGGEVSTNNEKTDTSYLVIESYSISETAFSETTFVIGYCVYDTSVSIPVWTRYSTMLPVLGGNPKNFLSFFHFPIQESANAYQEYWIPLEIKGSESRQVTGEITSASIKNLGGIFLEEVAVPAQGGIGSVKFTGTFIKPDDVATKVPPACIE